MMVLDLFLVLMTKGSATLLKCAFLLAAVGVMYGFLKLFSFKNEVGR